MKDKIREIVRHLLENKKGVCITTKSKLKVIKELRTTGILKSLDGHVSIIVVSSYIEGLFILKGISKILEEDLGIYAEESLKLHSVISLKDFSYYKNKHKKSSFIDKTIRQFFEIINL